MGQLALIFFNFLERQIISFLRASEKPKSSNYFYINLNQIYIP